MFSGVSHLNIKREKSLLQDLKMNIDKYNKRKWPTKNYLYLYKVRLSRARKAPCEDYTVGIGPLWQLIKYNVISKVYL